MPSPQEAHPMQSFIMFLLFVSVDWDCLAENPEPKCQIIVLKQFSAYAFHGYQKTFGWLTAQKGEVQNQGCPSQKLAKNISRVQGESCKLLEGYTCIEASFWRLPGLAQLSCSHSWGPCPSVAKKFVWVHSQETSKGFAMRFHMHLPGLSLLVLIFFDKSKVDVNQRWVWE